MGTEAVLISKRNMSERPGGREGKGESVSTGSMRFDALRMLRASYEYR
jgi:hypothetical protein